MKQWVYDVTDGTSTTKGFCLNFNHKTEAILIVPKKFIQAAKGNISVEGFKSSYSKELWQGAGDNFSFCPSPRSELGKDSVGFGWSLINADNFRLSAGAKVSRDKLKETTDDNGQKISSFILDGRNYFSLSSRDIDVGSPVWAKRPFGNIVYGIVAEANTEIKILGLGEDFFYKMRNSECNPFWSRKFNIEVFPSSEVMSPSNFFYLSMDHYDNHYPIGCQSGEPLGPELFDFQVTGCKSADIKQQLFFVRVFVPSANRAICISAVSWNNQALDQYRVGGGGQVASSDDLKDPNSLDFVLLDGRGEISGGRYMASAQEFLKDPDNLLFVRTSPFLARRAWGTDLPEAERGKRSKHGFGTVICQRRNSGREENIRIIPDIFE